MPAAGAGPMVAGLGEVVWVVDLNRQSLDRVVPAIGTPRLQGMFAAAGWQVLTAKYGHLLEELMARPGGRELRARIDEMSNPEYQRLLRYAAGELRDRLPGTGPGARAIRDLLAGVADPELRAAIRNLAGHDLAALADVFPMIDDSRPTVIFAYTIKGYDLPTEGHPQNHSALLSAEQMTELAARCGADPENPWQKFPYGSPEDKLCAATAERLRRDPAEPVPVPDTPTDLGRTPAGVASTQAALGRALLDLNRAAPEAGRRIVTVSPDVASSTNLGGWVNKVGVWSQDERSDWFADDAATILHWREKPSGQHIEPAFAVDVEWVPLACLARLGRADGSSAYLRLSTRPVNQSLAAVPSEPQAREQRRAHVMAGGYVLRAHPRPAVTLCVMGAPVTEAVTAAGRLDELGFGADVVCLTSPTSCSGRCGPGEATATRPPGSWTPCSRRSARCRW